MATGHGGAGRPRGNKDLSDCKGCDCYICCSTIISKLKGNERMLKCPVTDVGGRK